jgi:hypothetical protein
MPMAVAIGIYVAMVAAALYATGLAQRLI